MVAWRRRGPHPQLRARARCLRRVRNTGSLVQVNRHGGFTMLAGGLDRPTSLELIGRSAYVVTLTGEVWRLSPS